MLAQILPLRFRPIFSDAPADHRHEGLDVSLSRCQNTAPASSGSSSLSMRPLLQPKSQFTAELASSHLLVEWRFLTLARHRLPFDKILWIASIACEQTCSPLPCVFLLISLGEDFDECTPYGPNMSGKWTSVLPRIWACVVPSLVMQH